jgi:hypothetical protein
MKKLLALTSLSLSLLLAACSTTSTTKVTTYDSQGNMVSSSTSTSTTNQTVEAVVKAGGAVKDGAVAGYEWIKEKSAQDQPGQSQPAPEAQ